MRLHLPLALLFSTATLASAAEPAKPFNHGNLSGWLYKTDDPGKSQWVVGNPSLREQAPQTLVAAASKPGSGAMINLVSGHGQGVDIYSEAEFGSCRIEVEVMVAKGSNSGIYVHGEYEIQVLDSYGKEKMGPGDMGAVYGAAPPPVNACKAPGEWQKYVIEFQAPTFGADGKKTANARFLRIELNGQILHRDLELEGPTPGGVSGKEKARGPLMFQGDHGPVAYRNLVITPAQK